MDAVNVDLKAFTERFYRKVCVGHLDPVLDTLRYLRHETDVWLEITTLLIPGENDSDAELHELTSWVMDNLGSDVPIHFSAFHPDWTMRDKPRTPAATLARARRIAMENGLRYAYTGNVHDRAGDTTLCPGCGAAVIERDWYRLLGWQLDAQGCCSTCGESVPGVFEEHPGSWGSRRQPLRIVSAP